MGVKLYKADMSPPSRACMIGCELFHVPVEHVDVDLAQGAHRTPEFLKKNPLHTIPVLEDGDLIVNDSHAILMYIADFYNKQDSWYPKEPKQRSHVNQKLFFNSTILFPRLRNITFPLFIQGIKDISQKNLDAIEEAYGFVEEFLKRSKYLAGNNMTIADISAYTTVTGLMGIVELNTEKFPKTQAWLKEIGTLSSVQKQNTKGGAMYKETLGKMLFNK